MKAEPSKFLEKGEKMTKNNAMRLGSVMLVLALLTTCALSGTFAKYVTSTNSTANTARVAKWGITLTADTASTKGFQKTYAATDATKTASSNLITNSVISTANVLAPGTSGDLGTATISGTPEVAGKITLADSTVTLSNWTETSSSATGAYYCPIKVTIKTGNQTQTLKGTDYNNVTAFKNAIETALDNATVYFAANTAISATVPTISWEWPFDDNSVSAKQTDAKDTSLGNASTAPSITFNIATKVEQLD